jgi:hypothetical protein
LSNGNWWRFFASLFFSFGWLSPLISKLVGEMERLFQAASHQKAWDHFTKAQRKSLESWKKHVMVCYLIFKPIPIFFFFSFRICVSLFHSTYPASSSTPDLPCKERKFVVSLAKASVFFK